MLRKMTLLQAMESAPSGQRRRYLASVLLDRNLREPRRFVRFRRRFGGREDTLTRWRWMTSTPPRPDGYTDRKHRFCSRMVDEIDGKVTTGRVRRG